MRAEVLDANGSVLASMMQEQMRMHQEQMKAMMQMVTKSNQRLPTHNVADIKGLAKVKTFTNKEDEYDEWRRKTLNFLGEATTLKKSIKDILTTCTECKTVIKTECLKSQFPDIEEDDIDRADELIFMVLDNHTEGESNKIVNGAGDGNGYEAWRRLQSRWDPYTAGRTAGSLDSILNPIQATIGNMLECIEDLETKVRRYCSRRRPDGSYHVISEEIRMYSLRALCLEDLRKHIDLNWSHLNTYEALRKQIVGYVENVLPYQSHPSTR